MGFGRIPDLVACGPTHGAGPIIALELVRSPAELAELFGAPPCSEKFRVAQLSASWWDALVFIPAYATFLILGALALRRDARTLGWIAMAVLFAAALLDQIEGVILLQILPVGPDAQSLFDMLFVAVRAKFALLGIGELLLALLAWRGALIARLSAVPLAAGGLVSLWFLLSAPHHPWMMQAHSYGWMALLALALVGAINPRWVRRA
ncbi:hypothetical protein J2W22_000145 [Sphingomonas kyeonggiensis]|uniref:hypothetical protein n=1 Tax=Sphingomonas kyeonggiensis TaxID=1268553 RepID=UPI0027856664|nr:hypothetical protein [Sphingomonas kyeonggiensis]MDQ0248098.1 hypothetical protein [Sphingomonas kyeonggiensis]